MTDFKVFRAQDTVKDRQKIGAIAFLGSSCDNPSHKCHEVLAEPLKQTPSMKTERRQAKGGQLVEGGC